MKAFFSYLVASVMFILGGLGCVAVGVLMIAGTIPVIIYLILNRVLNIRCKY